MADSGAHFGAYGRGWPIGAGLCPGRGEHPNERQYEGWAGEAEEK